MLSLTCVGTEVPSWSFTQEVAGLSHFSVMANILVTEFAEFGETFKMALCVDRHKETESQTN